MFFRAGLMRRWWQLSWNGASPLVKISYPIVPIWIQHLSRRSSQRVCAGCFATCNKVLHKGCCGLLQEAQRIRQDSCMQCFMDSQQSRTHCSLFIYQIKGWERKRYLLLFPNPRKDKYSSKRDKYFVDFKDLESRKELNEEMEEHSERTKAPICLYFYHGLWMSYCLMPI